MASPSNSADPTMPGPAGVSYDQDLVSDSGSSYTDSEGASTNDPQPTVCPWRTPQYHQQECSRYLDCPSHSLERTASEPPIDDFPRRRSDVYGMADHRTSSHERPAPTARSNSLPDITDGGARLEGAGGASLGVSIPSGTSSAPQLQEEEDGSEQYTSSEDELVGEHGGALMQSLSSDRSHSLHHLAHHDSDDEEPRTVSRVQRPGASYPVQASESPYPYGYGIHEPVHGFQRPRTSRRQDGGRRRSSDIALPRWQPDAEVTYCPICQTQFSIFVRKHHCRKCGRVVCNSCSPHRIIIPHQYIVRPPGSEIPMPQSLLMDSLGVGYFDVNGMSGGERVRLCNPCVPDPNTAPPQGPASPGLVSPMSPHQRNRNSMGDVYGVIPAMNRYGMVFSQGPNVDPFSMYTSSARNISMAPALHGMAASNVTSSRHRNSIMGPMSGMNRYAQAGPSSTPSASYTSGTASSSRQRRLPPTPQIAEEDECPICHRELPSRELPNFDALRETHITTCIQSHSTYGSPRGPRPGVQNEPPPPPRRTGMYGYTATEKDCVDDAECTICLEEFTVGVAMARLECLCRFHRSCITAWFVNHPGRCPVHQHDGFGY